jgi:hypothetical protein
MIYLRNTLTVINLVCNDQFVVKQLINKFFLAKSIGPDGSPSLGNILIQLTSVHTGSIYFFR